MQRFPNHVYISKQIDREVLKSQCRQTYPTAPLLMVSNIAPKIIQVDYNRFVRHKRNLYSPDWKYMDVAIKYETDPNIEICKPVKLNEMLGMAQSLSQNILNVVKRIPRPPY